MKIFTIFKSTVVINSILARQTLVLFVYATIVPGVPKMYLAICRMRNVAVLKNMRRKRYPSVSMLDMWNNYYIMLVFPEA